MSRSHFMSRDEKRGSASHRHAPKMEKRIAKESGGRVTPGSGCSYQKGDVKDAWGCVRIEAKGTKNKSFSVTREMVAKIEDAALPSGEIPAIVIDFLDDHGKVQSSVAVVPTYMLPLLGD